MKNLYTILGIEKTASPERVKKGYFTMAKKYHPDAGDKAEIKKFYEVTEAYEILSDKEKRRAYDLALEEGKIVSELVSNKPSVGTTEVQTNLYSQFRAKEARRFRSTILWQGILRVLGFSVVCAGLGYAIDYFLHGIRIGGGIAGFIIGFVWSLGSNFDVDSFIASPLGQKAIKKFGWVAAIGSILYFIVILARRFV